MSSALGSYLSTLFGTAIEISLFALVYGYFANVSFNWYYILLYIVVTSLIIAPIMFFRMNALEKAIHEKM